MIEQRDRGLVTFTVAATAGIGTDVSRTHLRCFGLGIDPATGDAQITGYAVGSREEVGCGVVKIYTPPTDQSRGSVTLGSHTYVIRAGVVYAGDPAGQRADPLRPGLTVCLNGLVDNEGILTEHGPDRLTAGSLECGQVLSYLAPTASTPGEVRLAVGSSPKVIPVGVDVGDDPPGYRCFSFELDARGDLVVARRTDRLPPVVTSKPWPTRAP
jgi:hypothetical protein